MSLGEDYKAEMICESIGSYIKTSLAIQAEVEEGYWTIKDGTRIHISEMSNSHIVNTIKFIQKRDKTDLWMPWVHAFQEELQKRGISYE